MYSDTHSTMRAGDFHPTDFGKQDYFFGLNLPNVDFEKAVTARAL